MAILLRGHIRTAFDDEALFDLVERLHTMFSVDVYVHTWNRKQSALSWRVIQEDNSLITEDMVRNYFKHAHYLKAIIIDNDKECELHGRINGFIGGCPLLGWKRMHAGIEKGMSSIPEHYKFIINMRFDISFVSKHNGDTCIQWTSDNIVKMVGTYNGQPIKFMVDQECIGIDNCYMGTSIFMHAIARIFHTQLDELAWLLYGSPNQEKLVYRVVQMILKNDEFSGEKKLI